MSGYARAPSGRDTYQDSRNRQRSRSRSRERDASRGNASSSSSGYLRGDGGDYHQAQYREAAGGAGGGGYHRREYADRDNMGSGTSLLPSGDNRRPYTVGADGNRMLANSIASATGGGAGAGYRQTAPLAGARKSRDDRFADDEDDEEDEGNGGGQQDGKGSSEADSAPPAAIVDPIAAPLQLPEGLDEEQAMAAVMGFSSFDSTHGKKIEDNYTTAARGACAKSFTKVQEWRQYMHRGKGLGQRVNLEGKIVSRRVNGSGIHIDTSSSSSSSSSSGQGGAGGGGGGGGGGGERGGRK